ncbi:ferrous iron transporter B [Fuchsiella alkaliacetigena]|uniref:ferrous iron transporter B n=1 Tax=Fuchsiella alkaliacetigena TaxID=957042 RepID=UPI00200AEA13|nr:ferrous iron transporter B [Fuchsiella alkaliacetigena]MCK8825272.1 ferrous iron transporter B [Fuchsiella alkaliacetigena]
MSVKQEKRKLLLIGPPNVGKSVIFNRLTGLDVGMANYAGTTVEYKAGAANLNGEEFTLIDAPGTYTLDATNEAEQVAVDMLADEPEAVVCVMDANNLESSLYILLQVLEKELPTVVVLNRIDLVEEKGLSIDVDLLEEKLGVAIIPTVAVTGQGFAELEKTILETVDQLAEYSFKQFSEEERWQLAEELAVSAQQQGSELGLLQREQWGEWLVQPWPGLPLAVLILGIIFAMVIGVGLGIRQYLLLPFFRNLVFPKIIYLVEGLALPISLERILIGEYGFLIKGLEWPFGLVFPYVISFYAALSVLEDSGYLPRLGILLDGLLSKIGLSGSNIVPLLLGYGCAIPGIMSTRAMGSQKERLMVAAMISLAIPCIAQTGAIISLLAERSILIVFFLFLISILALVLTGFVLDFFMKGAQPYTVVEVPELLLPKWNVLGKKIWIRIKNYIFDGAIPMILAIGLAALLYESGALVFLGRAMRPLITGWLHLPEEAAVPLVLGIVRRELSVLPLLDMELSSLQLFIGALVGLFYVPCIAVLATLAREFKISIAVGILVATTSIAFLLGGIMTRLGELILV